MEIAKGLLHNPRLLLLDEPSTGLDPGARGDLWQYLQDFRDKDGVTAVVTTHLMEEAEHCDRLAILDEGRLVADGPPEELRSTVGGDCITITSDVPQQLAENIAERFQITTQNVAGNLRIEQSGGHELVRELVEAFPEQVRTITLGKPTLQDVFIHLTGHQFWGEDESNDEYDPRQRHPHGPTNASLMNPALHRAAVELLATEIGTLTAAGIGPFLSLAANAADRRVGTTVAVLDAVRSGAARFVSSRPVGRLPEMSYQEYFFPGVAVMIVMFTAIFSTISIIEDRREGISARGARRPHFPPVAGAGQTAAGGRCWPCCRQAVVCYCGWPCDDGHSHDHVDWLRQS